MNKKHEIRFNGPNGEFSIATDDLDDVLANSTVQRFLLNEAKVTHRVVADNAQDSSEDVDKLKAQFASMARAMREMQRELQGAREERPRPMPPQQQQSVLPQQPMQQSMPPPPPGAHAPSKSFLDIIPPDMKAEVWNTLSPEQQQEWMRKYKIAV